MNGFYDASLSAQFMVVMLVCLVLIVFGGIITTIINKVAEVRQARWEAFKSLDEAYSRGRRADEQARRDALGEAMRAHQERENGYRDLSKRSKWGQEKAPYLSGQDNEMSKKEQDASDG